MSVETVLEVRQLWGEVLMQTQHFRASVGTVWVGQRLGWRWELLGVKMGWVESPWHLVLPWLPPVWSEVNTVARDDFAAAAEDLLGADAHPLFSWDDSCWVAHLPGGGARRIGAEPESIPVGELRFEARVVAAGRRAERVPWALDRSLGFNLSMMAMLAMAFGFVVANTPATPQTSVTTVPEAFEALLRLPEIPPEVRVPKPDPVHEDKTTTDVASRRNPRRRGGPGLRSPDREVVQVAGVFSGGGFDRLLGADAELDPSLRALVGTLRAKGDGGTDIGVGGAGDRASLRGGGGDVEGVGDIDGWGPGREPGWGEHDGFGDKPSGEMVGIASEPVIVGTLTAREVDEVVKRHLRRVRHCYQRELQREPALAGKLTVRFTIASDGSVSRARIQDDTLGNDAVDRCVVSRFYSMTFPKPRGSSKGVVLVNYPFVFAPG